MLTHLLLQSLNHQRTSSRPEAMGTRLVIPLCYAAVLLPVPADGFVTAGLMAALAGAGRADGAAGRRRPASGGAGGGPGRRDAGRGVVAGGVRHGGR